MKYHTEEYLKLCLTKYQRSLLSQFRAGILPLRIETGRFHVKNDIENGNVRHLQVEEHTCQMCNTFYWYVPPIMTIGQIYSTALECHMNLIQLPFKRNLYLLTRCIKKSSQGERVFYIINNV